jgi:hypothetical protein
MRIFHAVSTDGGQRYENQMRLDSSNASNVSAAPTRWTRIFLQRWGVVAAGNLLYSLGSKVTIMTLFARAGRL